MLSNLRLKVVDYNFDDSSSFLIPYTSDSDGMFSFHSLRKKEQVVNRIKPLSNCEQLLAKINKENSKLLTLVEQGQ